MERYKKLRKQISRLLDQGLYVEAKSEVLLELSNLHSDDEDYVFMVTEIAGCLVDIGSEGYDFDAAQRGLELLKEKNKFEGVITEDSYFYNLGNAYEAMQKSTRNTPGLPSIEQFACYLAEAKISYYKIFKKIDIKNIDFFGLQVLTNLANNLSSSGRIIEALQLYSSVLTKKPYFVHSQIGLAENLAYWIKISYCPQTISLHAFLLSLYLKSYQYPNLPPNRRADIETKISLHISLLNAHNFSCESLESELAVNEKEYLEHSLFRRFCLDNFLALNEHSLYCKCYEASKDDLSIGYPDLNVQQEKLGRMELLLNRLKAEFDLARKLYYEGITTTEPASEIYFNELMDGEIIGESSEKIRNSFKSCFSIFDRIAHGICYFFDLNPKNEHIYFDSFWSKPNIWTKIKGMNNPHIVALYGIANDFNRKGGEFSHYKIWRNKLEHNNIVLVENLDDPDPLKLFSDEVFVTKIPYSFFKQQALHLLRICCAAIYSYTYLIRTESLISKEVSRDTHFTIRPKQK